MTIVNRSIDVKGLTIRAKLSSKGDDYISLTDIAKYKSERPAVTVEHWLRQYNTIEYLGVWEQLHNDNFKVSDFEDFNGEVLWHS